MQPPSAAPASTSQHVQQVPRAAPICGAFLGLNLVAFVGQLALARTPGALASMPPGVMLLAGANYAAATAHELRVETLLTACLLHWNALHIAFNLYALRQIGPPVERAIGPGRMAPLLIVSGIAGNLVSAAIGVLSHEERISAGASGAICGVIGAALVLGYRAQGTRSPLARAMARWLLMLLVIQFVSQLAGLPAGFDNAAHFGGAATGGLFAAGWRRGPGYSEGGARVVTALIGLLVVGSFAAVAYRDRSDPFAPLRADERFALATSLLHEGRCVPALAAVRATARLIPTAPELVGLENEYHLTCGN